MPPKKTPVAEPEAKPVEAETEQQTSAAPEAEVSGDGGAREEEVSRAIDAVSDLHRAVSLEDETKLVASLAGFFVDLFKHRPKPWSQLSQAEQRDLAAGLEHNAREIVRMTVEAVARQGREPIRALLEGYTEKDGIKVTLKVKPLSEDEALLAVIGLHKAQGKHVLLTVASADDYAEHPAPDPSEPDQHALGFEAGSDDIPLDEGEEEEESDLQAEALILRTGVQTLVPGHGLCEVRVNLGTGMIEALVSDGDGQEVVDFREATAAELAAERERNADFVEA